MRKANVITALALTMVMLTAMTGLATAANVDIAANPIINPLDGTVIYTNLKKK